MTRHGRSSPPAPALPRGRRGPTAVIVTLLILTASVLSAIAAIEIYNGRRSTMLGNIHTIARWLRSTAWRDTPIVITGAVSAALGLLLVLLAITPPRRHLVGLGDTEDASRTGMSRRSLRRDLSTVAADVDGITTVRVRIRRTRVTVRVTSQLRDRSGLTDTVAAALTNRLAELPPTRSPRIRVRVRGKDT